MTNRFHLPSNLPFYAVINQDRQWIDSAQSFANAVHWACVDAKAITPSGEDDIDAIWNAGYSIVHSTLLSALIEAGQVR